MNEAKKQKGLWHNIHQRRKKGLPPKKPGQKGYPKTLDIEESIREIVRGQILREYGVFDAILNSPHSVIPGIIGIFKEIFGSSDGERLREMGDDRVISDYQNFMGTLHLLPEYRIVWENYKQAQRRHSSMDPDSDGARDTWSPAGKAFRRLRSRVLMKFDELERTLSQENREIWQSSVDESRAQFTKIFSDWERGKITTGRVLSMLDARGIVEGSARGSGRISEAGEMFWGEDAVLMQLSNASNVIETALMDMEDVGCPVDSFAHTHLDQALDDLEAAGKLGDVGLIYDEIIQILHGAQTAARNCREIDRDSAYRIARNIDAVEKEISDWAHSDNSGIEF